VAAPRLRSIPRNVTAVTRVLSCVDRGIRSYEGLTGPVQPGGTWISSHYLSVRTY
jgi:hypothetical protein